MIWSAEWDHITSNFSKAVFHRFYLVLSWISWPKYIFKNKFPLNEGIDLYPRRQNIVSKLMTSQCKWSESQVRSWLALPSPHCIHLVSKTFETTAPVVGLLFLKFSWFLAYVVLNLFFSEFLYFPQYSNYP